MSARNLLIDRRGSVAVEFAIISVVLMVFIVFITDLVMRQSLGGKLDRVTYSAVSVFRERTQLFDSKEAWNNTQQVWDFSRRMLQDLDPDADLSKLTVVVQNMSYSTPGDQYDYSKPIIYYSGGRHGQLSESECEHGISRQRIAKLPPRGSYGRWVPMLEITVCLPMKSWFSQLWKLADQSPIISSTSVAILR